MKKCADCKHALWKRNAAGNLHPSGDGMCQYPWGMPELPVAFYWISRPAPSGGPIHRKRDNVEHCVYWARAA
jgi:hypothetical protein